MTKMYQSVFCLKLKAQFDCENMEVYYVDSEGDYVSTFS